jgi:hypothetical protein
MYKLKNMVKRGSAFAGAVGLLAGIGTSAMPALVSADALNPLTERSLTLSSSSPGWSYFDGSGNVTYAPPHSGANGQKTGEAFSFRMSSASTTVKAMTFQFCTSPAGNCMAPGNNSVDSVSGNTTVAGTGTIDLTSGSAGVAGTGTDFADELNVGSRIVTAGGNVYTVLTITDADTLTLSGNASATETGVAFEYRTADTESTSDLNVVTSSPGEISATNWADVSDPGTTPSLTPPANNSMGNFVVLHRDGNLSTPADWDDYTHSTTDTWAMTRSNAETGTFAAGTGTGNYNMIKISDSTGQALTANPGDYFKVVFFGTDTNYITNPGAGAFFVRMNTYSDASTLDNTTLIDGGVTVANVMNESITIQTKVLETMDFSVGTHDPDLYLNSALTTAGIPNHGQCSALAMANPALGAGYAAAPHNVLQLGDSNSEYSLRTDTAYDVQSYWRLSSNSSGGATVYYTGHTLTNTVGDEIRPLADTSGTPSTTGTEQFGLAINHGTSSLPIGPGGSNVESYPVALSGGESYGDEDGAGDGDFASFLDVATGGDEYVHYPRLYPLIPTDPYDDGNGTITSGGTAEFAFNENADSYAVPIATESDQVVNCVTAKMRYIANIAATTPAGIYTTKVNYVASPQY